MSILNSESEMNNLMSLLILLGTFAYIFGFQVPYDRGMEVITLLIGYVLGRFRIGRQKGF